ncbi:MAG TPA: phosphatase PAP2 family protein [Syntrophothermus lipocalidus]|nr:phosphatase PAP2 family protein [Syntrophothermus lipocalidus]
MFGLDWHSLSEALVAYGSIGLLIVAFAESSFFPIPPDILLIGLSVNRPGLALWYAAITTGGSVIGGLFGYFLGVKAGRPLLSKLVSAKRLQGVEELFARYGGWAVAVAGFTPIPYKIFTIASGIFRIRKRVFVLASLVSRGARFFFEGFLLFAAGARAQEFITKYFELITIGLVLAFTLIYVVLRHTPAVSLGRNLWTTGKTKLENFYSRRLAWLHQNTPLLPAATLVASVCLLVFASLAEELLENELEPFDLAVSQAVAAFHHPALTAVMKSVTVIGSPAVMTGIAVILWLCLTLTRKRSFEALTVVLVLAGAGMTNEVLKNVFHRIRPELAPLVPAPGYSFPSGHAMMSTAFYGFLAYLVFRHSSSPVTRWAFSCLAALLVLAIGFSRVYLGVHYPSDVLAGFAAGGFWLASSILCLELLQPSQNIV